MQDRFEFAAYTSAYSGQARMRSGGGCFIDDVTFPEATPSKETEG
ncbi:hypothetical protein [Alicyclobacillus sp. SP_1]|jgi:hypothetical protein|nr:hypothetical protein [Alicyclobacillus sp. SP_1]